MKVFELLQERAKQAAEARRLVELAITEQRENSAEELAAIDVCITGPNGIEAIERKVKVLSRVEAVEAEGRNELDRRGRPAPLPTSGDPLAEAGTHEYSVLRAIRCLLGLESGGLETECHQDLEHRTGKKAQGFFIPWNVTNRAAKEELRERRALNLAAGVGSIANILGVELIELLRNRMVTAAMGARVLEGMTGGTFSLPKQTGTVTAYWVAEGTAPTGSNLTIGQVTWTPKTVGAFTDMTRKFILQTNQAAEALARDDITRLLAIELDRAGINGSGAGQEPKGILQNSSVPTVAMGTNGGLPTWLNLLALEKTVAVANADFGKLGYLTSNGGRNILKGTPKVGTTFPQFMWENDNMGTGIVNGYRALASEQVPSNLTKGTANAICTAVIYGNWDSLTYAFWSGLDILIDPYTGGTSGTLRIIGLQDCDIQNRYDVSFAKIVDLLQA